MDNRPIGVFDSGLGGITAVRELQRVLPSQPIIYFGDTGRVPYGGRSREAIIRYARQDIRFLRTFDLKLIVMACGTMSTAALDTVKGECDIPIIGVVEPSVVRAVSETRNGRIGVIGTAATIRSGAYERLIAAQAPGAQVVSAACPLFVPLVENGHYGVGDIAAEAIAREYLKPLAAQNIDTLILGCTHYPLLRDVIANIMGPGVTLVDAGEACAENVARSLERENLLDDGSAPGICRFFVSDDVGNFAAIASIFLGRSVSEEVEQVDIFSY